MDRYQEAGNWARAYLQWMDGEPERPGEPRKIDVFRETMMQMAARTERDCQSIVQALREAERLLEDERSAWQALAALYRCDRRRARAERGDGAQDGGAALAALAADVRALERRVVELSAQRSVL